MRRNLSVVLMCISLVTKSVECLFIGHLYFFWEPLWYEEVLMGQLGPFLLLSLEDGNSSPEAFRQTNYSYTTNKHH